MPETRQTDQPRRSSWRHAGERAFHVLLGAVVILAGGYGLYAWFGTSPRKHREPIGQPDEWSIPQSWQAVPELLYHGRVQEAINLVADEDTAVNRPAEQLYLLGLLAAYFDDAKSCRSLLERATRLRPAAAPDVKYRVIETKLDNLKLTREDLRRETFTLEDVQYVSRAFIYRCIAEAILEDVPEGVDQAEALVAWTRRMIAPFEPEAYDVLPVVVLARGYGACDRLCWVLLALAGQKGIPGYMVYLADPKTGQSAHTLCQIFPGGVPVLCDPVYGLVFQSLDGEPLDLYRVQREPLIARQYPEYSGELGEFLQHARIQWWPVEAQAVFGRMKVLQAYADRLPLAPRLFQDADREMNFLNRYLYTLPGGTGFYRDVRPQVGGYPFIARRAFLNAEHLSRLSQRMKPYEPIAQPRLLQLQGRFRMAERKYAQVIRSDTTPETLELARLFHAQCLYELGDFDTCRPELDAFLKSYPESMWTDHVKYYLKLIDLSSPAGSLHPASRSEDAGGTGQETPQAG